MSKIQTPPPLVKVVYIWNVDYFDFGFDPPPLWTFSPICDISFLDGSPKVIFVKLVMKGLINCVKLG